ncbi:glycosyltransferase family 2 protein [Rosistilla oblonga]|uniref:glycosyltransferase family 2 protein n=1 Tax=Rosistilla oblonga TaxID=2527990 RepID=UPI003A97AC81
MQLSVLTIVRGREKHLYNQWLGLMRSSLLPAQWIIVGMDQDVALPPEVLSHRRRVQSAAATHNEASAATATQTIETKIDVRTARVDGDGEQLPLAEARNRAAELCQTDAMIFLDVDCIPAPSMLETFRQALRDDPRLWMGNVRYLPAGAASDGWQMDDLDRSAVDHPLQPRLIPGERHKSQRYELFWSLCFAATKQTFDRIGGFDPTFDGYGGEDTDFAFAARRQKVPFGFVAATAYHQHHPVCKPPLNHFHAIVRNAKRFQQKWGVWPMESWLHGFAQRGLVEFRPAEDLLRIVREPSPEEVRQARTKTAAGF